MRKLIIRQATTLLALAGLALSLPGHAAGQATRGTRPVTTEADMQTAKTPYTAEYKVTHERVLADGTTIIRETTEVKALDSQGRRMTATTIASADRAPITHLMVYDPVTRTQTFWHSPGKVPDDHPGRCFGNKSPKVEVHIRESGDRVDPRHRSQWTPVHHNGSRRRGWKRCAAGQHHGEVDGPYRWLERPGRARD
jgi:hypothetical protein